MSLGRRPALSCEDVVYAIASAETFGARAADLAYELGVGSSTLYRSLGRVKRTVREERAPQQPKDMDVWRARTPAGHIQRYVVIRSATAFVCAVDVYDGDPEGREPVRRAEWPVGVVERRFRRVR